MAFHSSYGVMRHSERNSRPGYPEPGQPFFHHRRSYYGYKPVGLRYYREHDSRQHIPRYNTYMEHREIPRVMPMNFNTPPPHTGTMYHDPELAWLPNTHKFMESPHRRRYSRGWPNRNPRDHPRDQSALYNMERVYESPRLSEPPTRTNTPLSITAPSAMRTDSWTGTQSILSSSRISNDGSYESRGRSSYPPSHATGSPPSYHSDDFGLGRLSLDPTSGYESMDAGYAASDSSDGHESEESQGEPERGRTRTRRPRYVESDRLSTAVDRGRSPGSPDSRAGSLRGDHSGGSVYSDFFPEDRHDGFSEYERSDEYYDSDELYSEDGFYYSHSDEDKDYRWD